MRLSDYFIPTLRDTPSEAETLSHRLMLRAGMVRQLASGIYAWLPLGLAVLRKIERIVREEQDAVGAIELLMPTIQPADLWRDSGRYDDYGMEMLRIKDRKGRELLYGPTNEEVITDIFRASCRSYKDVPKLLYHIQWKFRDELRPRFGVMRGREFLMKDAYSFDLDEASARRSYNKMLLSYLKTFARMGLKAIPMRADTGPIGGNMSHEFIVLAATGESQVFCDRALIDMSPPGQIVSDSDLSDSVTRYTTPYAATEEMHRPEVFAALPEERRITARGIEVGHIFSFGTKYSAPMRAYVQGPDGDPVPVQMGSYGIGVSRLVGAVVEACHDAAGIVWPQQLAPFGVGVLNLDPSAEATNLLCTELYEKLVLGGREPLYDDTHDRPGEKFTRMDLIGLPWQLIVGPKGLRSGVVELKFRATGARQELSAESALARLLGSSST